MKTVSARYKLPETTNAGARVYYRPGTSDEWALNEVINKRAYARPGIKFDVEVGENWLDLGANIGSFAVYTALRGASVVCYEPDPGCFELLSKNAPSAALLYPSAITVSKAPSITFYRSPRTNDHYRGTTFPRSRFEAYEVKNTFVGIISKARFDGIKMDIEGGEVELILSGRLPKSNKLVMEYHTSVNATMKDFKLCMDTLRKRYDHVKYPAEFDRALERGEIKYKTFVDRIIYCWNGEAKDAR